MCALCDLPEETLPKSATLGCCGMDLAEDSLSCPAPLLAPEVEAVAVMEVPAAPLAEVAAPGPRLLAPGPPVPPPSLAFPAELLADEDPGLLPSRLPC